MGLAFCTDIFSPLRNLVYRKYPLTLHGVTRAAESFDKAPVVLNCLPFLGYEKWEALLWLETLCTTSV